MHQLIYRMFRVVRYLDGCRRTRQVRWNLIVGLLFAAAALLIREYIHFAPDTRALFWLDRLKPLSQVHRFALPLATGALSAVAMVIFTAFVFPLLAYLPFTIAHKDLGIVATSMDSRLVIAWMGEAARRAISSTTDRIKVVCLTGKHLWQTPPFDGVAAPLAIAASAGKLDVIMPCPDPKHPTVQARFATYTDSFKNEQNINSEDDLVKEMAKSKADLLRRSNANTITEHCILCMWRIVLTEEFCIVQSYFPNHGGVDSFKAPAFFYKNVNVGKAQGAPRIDCLYDTYAHLVELIGRPNVGVQLRKRSMISPISQT